MDPAIHIDPVKTLAMLCASEAKHRMSSHRPEPTAMTRPVLSLLLLIACTSKSPTADPDTASSSASPTETGGPSPTDSDHSSVVGSDGCGLETPDGLTALTVGTRTRTLDLHIPADYDPSQPYPLIFAWHGLGGSGRVAQFYFGLEAATEDQAIIAYPNGLPRSDSGDRTGWDLNPAGHDFEFFDAMVESLTQGLCIDEQRIYSTGHSYGGYMSNAMGCYRGQVHAAIAPVAGGPPFYGDCSVPVATWLTHGDADPTVEISEGERALSRWLQTNSCEASSIPTEPDGCVAYEGCQADVHWCVHPGDHAWPSFAGQAIWDFFSVR
jgi:polyhydroxybutyrate depolymerase